tara:strand:+ start:81 stop:992 length:912 start_codon:yes stop_codon:yes gene_type:complete
MATTLANLADSRTQEALSAEFLLKLADRASLMQHPAIAAGYAGTCTAAGSAVMRLPHVGFMGYDLLASVADGANISETTLVDDKTDITVGRYGKMYKPSDLARLTAVNGLLDPEMFAADAFASYQATLVSLMAGVMDDFTATKGNAAADLDASAFLDAITALEVAKVDGGLMAILSPLQVGDLRKNLSTATNGALQWIAAETDQLVYKSGNFKGSFLGVEVYSSSFVPDVGTAFEGGMFGAGAIAWADGSVGDVEGAINVGGKVLFEADRDAKAGATEYVTQCYLGVTMGIDAAGVTLTSADT